MSPPTQNWIIIQHLVEIKIRTLDIKIMTTVHLIDNFLSLKTYLATHSQLALLWHAILPMYMYMHIIIIINIGGLESALLQLTWPYLYMGYILKIDVILEVLVYTDDSSA